ncbi:MAG: glycoside hydrolase family 3 N-terminal domain-containing protein [Chloroflexota bacterium]
MQRTHDLSYKNPALSNEERVENLLNQMTLAEKIGQMTQVEKNSLTPAEVNEYFIGSVLSGGGGNPTPNTPQMWRDMVESFQQSAFLTPLAIPLLYGSDAVHGHNNVIGSVIFPHNIGLGATRDEDLQERIGHIVAVECMATGVRWDFAPAVSVPQDIRWGRIYEGYSENTELVTRLAMAFMRGLQGAEGTALSGVLASVKHYVADGGTTWADRRDSAWVQNWGTETWGIDQGNAEIDEPTLRTVHLAPYQTAIKAGAMNIMVSYSSWQGIKMHAHHYLLTDVLKNEFGFQGFLVSDWKAVDQITPDYYQAIVIAVNAGIDMIMVPFDFKTCVKNLTLAVDQGEIPLERIDDAVKRILLAKFRLGLFERPFTDPSLLEHVGSSAHREVAREAVRKSLVLLKNHNHVLPLSKATGQLLVAGAAADNIGLQCGGWTIEWMGKTGNSTSGTTILDGIRQTVSNDTVIAYSAEANFDPQVRAEVGILVLAEEPYAEGPGDRADLALSAKDIEVARRLEQHCEKVVAILLSGRPLLVSDQLAEWDAFVAAWLPGTEGQGIADVLFGDYPFTGKLGFTWPRTMQQIPLQSPYPDNLPPMWEFGFGLEA